MSAVIKDLQRQLDERQRSFQEKTAEVVSLIAAIPEGAVDRELLAFVEKAHEEAKADVERLKNGNGKPK